MALPSGPRADGLVRHRRASLSNAAVPPSQVPTSVRIAADVHIMPEINHMRKPHLTMIRVVRFGESSPRVWDENRSVRSFDTPRKRMTECRALIPAREVGVTHQLPQRSPLTRWFHPSIRGGRGQKVGLPAGRRDLPGASRAELGSLGLRFCLEGLATIAASAGETERAARLFGAAETYRESLGTSLTTAGYRDEYEASLAATRAALGETRYTTAWADGRRFSLEEALAEAASVAVTPVEPERAAADDPARGTGLTSRELDVLHLLVEGQSRVDIAARLFISPRTFDNHATNILAKLDVTSSRAAVAAVHRLGLVEHPAAQPPSE